MAEFSCPQEKQRYKQTLKKKNRWGNPLKSTKILFYLYSPSVALVKCTVCTKDPGPHKHTFVWNLYQFIFAFMFFIFQSARYMRSKIKTNLHLFCLCNNFVSSENSVNFGLKPIYFVSVVNYWGGGKEYLAHSEACPCHGPSFYPWAFNKMHLAARTQTPLKWLKGTCVPSRAKKLRLGARSVVSRRPEFFPRLHCAVFRAGSVFRVLVAGLHSRLPLMWTRYVQRELSPSFEPLLCMKNLFQEFPSRPIPSISGGGRWDCPEARGKEKGWIHEKKIRVLSGRRKSLSNQQVCDAKC